MACLGPNKAFFLSWVKENYGKNSRTKTVTNEKYNLICRYVSGQDCKVNAKFRFWVRAKGFQLFAPRRTDEEHIFVKGKGFKEAELHVAFPSKQAKSRMRPGGFLEEDKILNGKIFKKVATIENFYDIIQAAHVNSSGSHAGQKKTYKMVSSMYAFLPREVVTFYLLNCDACKPRIEKYGPAASRPKMNRRSSLDTTSTSEEEEWEETNEEIDSHEEEDASSETSSSSSEQCIINKCNKMKSPLNSENVTTHQSIPNGVGSNGVNANSLPAVQMEVQIDEKPVIPTEQHIREPSNLIELLNQNTSASSPLVVKEDDDDNEDDDDEEGEGDLKSGKAPADVNPERLKAFNMFVRLFVDENLDRLVPISKQPKEKISAIILSCQRQFPEFGERARKRIRTYLKSCRRSSRLKEPMKRTAENMTTVTAHIPSTQLAEVNACQNETHEASKRARMETQHGIITPSAPLSAQKTQIAQAVHSFTHQRNAHSHNHNASPSKFDSISHGIPLTAKSVPVKLSGNEVAAVRQLINGYRESAAFLYRSADELENLLRQNESYHSQPQHKQHTQ